MTGQLNDRRPESRKVSSQREELRVQPDRLFTHGFKLTHLSEAVVTTSEEVRDLVAVFAEHKEMKVCAFTSILILLVVVKTLLCISFSEGLSVHL